ncbi:MAG: hypothetical protein ACLUIS_06405 [Longibaculum sp.]
MADKLGLTVAQIKGNVSIVNETNTQIIAIAKTNDPELSKIVDQMVSTFKKKQKKH